MMFKKPLATVLLAFLAFCSLLCFFMLRNRPHDEIFASLFHEEKKIQEIKTACRQTREGVCKEIWALNHGQHLHYKILSDLSYLVLNQQKNQIEVIEQMDRVDCIMQEELYYLLPDGHQITLEDQKTLLKDSYQELNYPIQDLVPMQTIRYLEAEKASFNYNTQTFIAENVKISKYNIHGHQLASFIPHFHPTMTGYANQIEFSLKNQTHFVAHGFKAHFESEKGVR